MPTFDGPQDACFREVEVERIVLREPGGHHRVRAVLETTPAPADPDDDRRAYPVVRLSLLDVAGDTALVLGRIVLGPVANPIGLLRILVLTTLRIAVWHRDSDPEQTGVQDRSSSATDPRAVHQGRFDIPQPCTCCSRGSTHL